MKRISLGPHASLIHLKQVPADMLLDDILNQFQKGSSHMTALLKPKVNRRQTMCGTLIYLPPEIGMSITCMFHEHFIL
ncbi:hypothetical protein DCAR_0830905 [Daucus carota subsp. sativus]|uniref:Uncharacterized protein n=1 Tax=Daucus carota subsp. sativus TaxID=79200 RepID=A0A175YKS1_DAUCS|nr:hypothetical protein DCAR_0830905 [Daucus carota subsp. sativus]